MNNVSMTPMASSLPCGRVSRTPLLRSALLIVAAILASVGCGGSGAGRAFTPTFPDNRTSDIQNTLAVVQAAPGRAASAVAVGVTSAPTQLFVYDLDQQRMLWTAPVQLRSVPVVAGDLVVTQDQGHVVARDLRSGRPQFEVEDEALFLVGADGERSRTVLTLSTGGGVGAHSKIVVAEEGAVLWEHTVDYAVGAPAIVSDVLFVPWGMQNVSALDFDSGRELARLRVDDVVGHAMRVGNDVYFGQSGLFHFDASIASGRRESATYLALQTGELPGRPGFFRDAYHPPPEVTSATHRVRLAWRPSMHEGTLTLEDNALYFAFYRLVFAMENGGAATRWVHAHESDVVGASVQPGGLLLADDHGNLAMLAATDGRKTWSASLGVTPTFVTFRAEGFSPAGEARDEAPSVPTQLLAAAQNPDARLVNARVLAVHQLAARPEGEATQLLIVLCDDRRAPPLVRNAACTDLGRRTEGADAVVTALERRASFLRGTTAPAVGPLAQAAANMHEHRAIQLLLAHLGDPATTTDELAQALAALKLLGDRTIAEPVQDWLMLYHAEEQEPMMARALSAAVDALVAWLGPVSEPILRSLIDDPSTMAALHDHAQSALDHLAQQDQAATQADAEEQARQEREAREAVGAENGSSNRPLQITTEMATAALDPVMHELRTCLRSDPTHPASVRMLITLDNDGHVTAMSTTPASSAACMMPHVRAQAFPATRGSSRQQVIFVVRP